MHAAKLGGHAQEHALNVDCEDLLVVVMVVVFYKGLVARDSCKVHCTCVVVSPSTYPDVDFHKQIRALQDGQDVHIPSINSNP